MKCKTLATALTAVFALTAAQPHRHGHQHFHNKRQASAAPGVATIDKTMTIYELNGKQISAAEVQEGIRNGSLVWSLPSKDAARLQSVVPSAASVSPVSIIAETPAPASDTPAPPTPADVTPIAESPAPEQTSSSSSPSTSPGESSGGSSGSSSSGGSVPTSGSNDDFPDGQIDCSEFPSQYGAIPVDWVGLGGWTGIQMPGSSSGGYGDIMTVTSDQCSNGSCCQEGAFCSYACQPGYQKVQWPETQGSTGQSVGGIQCSGGKLQLTNKSYKTLCAPGAQQVQVQVKNTMGDVVSVCRTDYPGTEGETVPLSAEPGSTQPLTMPDASTYYKWQNADTSAQYYLNPAGVPVEKACQWGSPANPWGNFAPMNLGVGWSNGMAWLSMFQNLPTTNTPLDFAVELVGDNMIGRCKYQNGQFCSGDNYEDCSSSGQGCTVSAASGTVTYVFSQ